jgi:hypothetical protein
VENHKFSRCASHCGRQVLTFSRSHVHGMMSPSRPPKAQANRTRHLAPRASGPFFFGGCRNLAVQKPLPTQHSSTVGPGVPFLEQKRGTNVKEAATTAAFTAGSTPNDRCPRKRHVWGTRQRRWFLTWPAPLLCLTRLFLCSRSHREKSKCSQIAMRLTSKAGDRSPYGQQDANFGLDPLEGWGPFLHGALHCPLLTHLRN